MRLCQYCPTPPRTVPRISPIADEILIFVLIIDGAEENLPIVSDTLNPAGVIPRLAQRRQKHRRQNRNDRKNCLFAGNEAGGQRLAILYSFAATCKANGICFRKWLEDVFTRLTTTTAGQIDSLIPGVMQRSQ